MKQQNYSIIFNPEIAATCLQLKLHDVYFIYQIIKSANKIDNHSGLITKKYFLYLTQTCFNTSLKNAYAKMLKGEHIFWEIREKYIQLKSINKIIKDIKPQLWRSPPVIFDFNILFQPNIIWDSSMIKAFLVGIVAARFYKHHPISIHTLMENTLLSESTVRRCLNRCPMLECISNYELVAECADPLSIIAEQKKISYPTLIYKEQNTYKLIKRLPNTYYFSNSAQMKFSKRPQALKHRDNDSYFIKNAQMTQTQRPTHIHQSNVIWKICAL